MATLRFSRATRSNSVSVARDSANNSAATTSGASGSGSSSSSSSGKTMKFVQKYLDGCRSFYSCIYCRTHLANHDELISRSFQGNRSRAYLFNTVINVSCGPSVQRELNTGAHSVADIFCANCGTTIGWKYERAFVDSQKYKEGKFIIELAHVVRENRHLELDKRDIFLGLAPPTATDQQQQQQRRRHNSPASIGVEHQGSLSPPSSTGQWSPGTSSSSSSASSPSSSLSPPAGSRNHHHLHHRRGASPRPNCRYSDLTQAPSSSSSEHNPLRRDLDAQRYSENHHDDQFQADDIDDDEVLMFPFYDDLYGERSSYSNLSASRSHQRSMQRRSQYLEASPGKWRRDANGSNGPDGSVTGASSSSSSVSPSATNRTASGQTQPHLFSCSSRSIEIPLNQTSQAQTDNSSSSCRREQQLAANKHFFATAAPATASSSSGSPTAHRRTVPPRSTPQASSSSLATVAAAAFAAAAPPSAARNNSEHVPNSGTTTARNDRAHFSDECHVDEEDTQFKFEHDSKLQQKRQLDADGSSVEHSMPSASNGIGVVRRNSQDQIRSEQAKASGSGFNSLLPDPSGQTDGDETIGAGQPLDNCDREQDGGASAAKQPSARSNSLSFDDDEFYDCNTDHDVSNSSFKAK